MLKFHIFLIFNCEELVRSRAIYKGLVRFFSDVQNWYSIFTNVKNWHQLFTPVKNWFSMLIKSTNQYQMLTDAMSWYQFFADVENLYQFFTDVKNWYQIFTGVNNWYLIFTDVIDRICTGTSEQVVNEELDAEISLTEIKNAIFAQKNNKSTGTDQICAEILKATFDIVSHFLIQIV